jgi:phosphoglucomutase/phosphomannomutase
VIAYDTRHQSLELARVCAEVIAGRGMRAAMFAECRPTPQLSFAVRRLGAVAGIVISASHNPPEDNGFKAYGPDGGQIAPPEDARVMSAVKRLSGVAIAQVPFDDAVAAGLIALLGPDEDEAYWSAVLACGCASARGAGIVYSPLNGTGKHSVIPVLRRAGFDRLSTVMAQEASDGSFKSVTGLKPNPEEPATLDLSAAQAADSGAEVAFGTDPDADRLGCVAVALPGPGAFRDRSTTTRSPLTGNQIATILCHHVLAARREHSALDHTSLVLTTAVTTRMIGKIAASYGVGCIEELLVGFKYVACVARSLTDAGRLVFACEESHGYLGGPYTRDKDAACAALLMAEAASVAKDAGGDLWSTLEMLYARHGYHCDIMFSEELSPEGGKARIRRMTNGMRSRPPRSIGGLRVERITDRLASVVSGGTAGRSVALDPIVDPATGVPIAALALARDNLLIFELGGSGALAGARLAIRPSGTEPKCKFYVSAWTNPTDDLAAIRTSVDDRTRALQDEFVAYARGFVSR